MRSCRSRRACSTFVSASVGGSQEKSSTSGGREAQGAGGSCRSRLHPATRNPQPQTPAAQVLTRAVQGHVAVVAARLTGSDAQAARLPLGSAPPVEPRMRAEMTLCVLRRRDAQSGACLPQTRPCPIGAPLGGSLWTKTFDWPGLRRGVSVIMPPKVAGPGSGCAESLFLPAAEGGDQLA